MSKVLSLYELKAEHHILCEMLEENGGEITPEIEEALCINADNFVTKADGYCEIIAKYAQMSAMAGERIKQLQTVKRIAENAERRMKERLQMAMVEYNLQKLECGVHKLSLRSSQAVEIIDEVKIPNEFIKVTTSVDKSALRTALLAGATIEGAELKTNTSLQIR